MKHIFPPLTFLLLLTISTGTSAQSASFQKVISSDVYTVYGTAPFHEYAIATPSSEHIICFSASIGTPGKFDIAMLKTDSSGAVIANNIFTQDPSYHDWVRGFTRIGNSYYMTGSSRAFDTSSFHNESAYMVKFDNNLNLLSQNNYLLPNSEIFAQSITPTADNKILITGTTVQNSNWSFFLLKTDTTGNLIWFKQYAQPINAAVVRELSNGDIMVAGSYPYAFQFIQPVACWFDSYGNLIWARNYNFSTGTFDYQNSTLEFIHDFGNGNIILAGRTDYSGAGALGFMDSYVLKITNSGSVVWAKTYGGFQNDWPYGYTVTPNDELVISGSTSSFFNNSNFGFVQAIDSSGALIYGDAFGDTTTNEQITLTGLRQLSATRSLVIGIKYIANLFNLYISDFTNSNSGQCPVNPVVFQSADATSYPTLNFTFVADSSITVYGNDVSFHSYSGLIDSVICEGITSVSESNSQYPVTVFPNPTNDLLQVQFPDNLCEKINVSFYNLVGEKISDLSLDKGINKLEVSAMAPGVYILSWKTGEISGCKKITIIR